jgi:DNA invertase Pin-like site-specific DNA recombinase
MSTKVAFYARISKDDGTQTTENQLARLRSYAEQHEMAIVRPYEDRCSGGDLNKPARKQLLKDARAHRFSIVLCTKIDRISRSTTDFYEFLSQLSNAGVKLEPIDQPELGTNSPSGELLMAVLAGVAQFERSLIRSRTLDGLACAKARGVRLGRPPNHAKTEEILALREQGLSYADIAAKFEMSVNGIRKRIRTATKGRQNQT